MAIKYSIQEAMAATLSEVPEGAEILEIDGAFVVGRCSNCGTYIIDDDPYFLSEDEKGIICMSCMGRNLFNGKET